MSFEAIRLNKILRAIGDMQLKERTSPPGVNMSFVFHTERLPADLTATPTAGLRPIYEAMAKLVYPETGVKGAVEWTLEFGDMQLDLKFNGNDAQAAREAWPQVKQAIANLRTQHLRN
jgi:hypothetical protein